MKHFINYVLFFLVFGFVLAIVVLFFRIELNVQKQLCDGKIQEIQNAFTKKQKKPVTGYSLFDAVNEYRKKNGVKELILSKTLCNNIGARALNYQAGRGHEGINKHMEEIGVYNIVELLATGGTEEEIISRWEGSPSHHLFLIDKKVKYGCAYADYYMGQKDIYTAVLLMSW